MLKYLLVVQNKMLELSNWILLTEVGKKEKGTGDSFGGGGEFQCGAAAAAGMSRWTVGPRPPHRHIPPVPAGPTGQREKGEERSMVFVPSGQQQASNPIPSHRIDDDERAR